ncbi:transcription regulator [Tasmannia lanceolata]|uniref:transcription regulator n=1 Tax=Tasmannia lanceolata TaxID=3420 RepID=UPI0040649B90
MKFLEYTPLESLNYFLSNVNLGECTLKGSLEAYSCKHTGPDRKLSLSFEHEILEYLGSSLDSDSSSPTDFLSSRSSRKTLIYLVLTLSHIYPDYDFSVMQAHNFFREEGWDSFKQIFNTYMFEAAKEWAVANGDSPLLESISKSIDEVVNLAECEIYSFNPDFEGDPFLEKGTIWSFNFFFYNRKLKRVISFRCCCLSNLAAEGTLADETFNVDDDGDIFDDMDL